MSNLMGDIKYGLRMLAKNPGFAAVVVLTLAIGIGANIAMFSVVNAVLLRPLPFRNAERLTVVRQHAKTFNITTGFSYPDFLDIRAQNQVFEDFAAYAQARFDVTEDQGTRRVEGAYVSGNLFSMLGVRTELGRAFTTGDEQQDSDLVTMISHDLWRSRYGQAMDVLGQTITMDGRIYTIVGVLPPHFQYPVTIGDAQIWTVLSPSSTDREHWMNRNNCWLSTVGCLKAGMTRGQALPLLNELYSRVARSNGLNPDSEVQMASLNDAVVGDVRMTLWVLSAIVGFLLVIVCANVANLCVAKASSRNKEVAIRRALGANNLRLLRQFTTESLVLSLCGGLIGVLITLWTMAAFKARMANIVPMANCIGIAPRELLFGLALSLLVGVALGVAPSWLMQRPGLIALLTERRSASPHHRRFSGTLIVGQIAVALILSVGTGLMIRSMMRLASADTGFNQDNMVTFSVDMGRRDDPQRLQFSTDFLERLKALPHVTGVATDSSMPCSSRANMGPIDVDGYTSPDGRPIMVISHNVSPDYFRTLQMPIRRGRAIATGEHQKKDRVVVISESLAQRFWPDQNPIEREVTFTGKHYRIIGTVGDVIQGNAKLDRPYHAFFPFDAAFHGSDLKVAVRAATDPGLVVEQARAILQDMDATLPLYDVSTFTALMNKCISRERFTATFLTLFASIGLLLIVVGIYGVVSYAVTQRTREIGIRMALGARKTSVLAMVLTHGLVLSVVGSAFGILGAVGLTRFLSSYLYGISATDPVTFVLVPLLIIGVSVLACWLPARRAAKVDPMVALRCE
jgi:putative ABC transport system permease protein